jgi:Bacterial regulatory protein, Fis family
VLPHDAVAANVVPNPPGCQPDEKGGTPHGRRRTPALRATGGNRAQAAAQLGIGAAPLYGKLRQFGAAVEP